MLLAQLTKESVDTLMRELDKKGIPRFSKDTINRLKNENPLYQLVIMHFANECAKECGPVGFEKAIELGAIYYHALELAQKLEPKRTLFEDPAPTIDAIHETDALLNKVMMLPPKDAD